MVLYIIGSRGDGREVERREVPRSHTAASPSGCAIAQQIGVLLLPKLLDGIVVVEAYAGRQQRGDVFGQASRQFPEHALLGFSPGDGIAFQRKVVLETRDELLQVQGQLPECFVEVEQVAALVPLQERP